MLTVACCVLVASANTVSSQTYKYDAQGRLTQVAYSDSMSVAYAYDSNSNLLSTTVAGDLGTSVQDPESDVLPKVFALQQNYPNPFNPTTTIEYRVPSASHVKLLIYNMLGQRVRTLLDEQKQPGVHQIVWDARDDFGRKVAANVYFYRFVAGDFRKIQKMVLVK